MKISKILAFAAVAVMASCAKQPQQRGFAIVIDPASYENCQQEIDRYCQTVESRGLTPILVIDRWGVPDSIRQTLIDLHSSSVNPIEGCVLIGDIPVAMVRDAQHMASAFKMDQDNYPRFDTHIPSDRFYDCFDLNFRYIDKDSTRWFYYSLEADGAQTLEPTIYSARITPRDNERGDKYEKLRRYMNRVNEADAHKQEFDRILFFGGSGNLSNSLVARMDAKWEFYDQYPWMLDQKQSVTYMDYSHDEYIKARLCDELQDSTIDYALLSHHGDPTIQYLSGGMEPEAILQTFEFSHYHPQARLVSLDACYNGSFHKDDNIQEAYLFGEGNSTMLVLANSVNSIQDKWANRYTGLLGLGMRAGYLARFGSFLEFHLFGDPTYQFAQSADCGFDINDAIVTADDNFWASQLDNEYPAVQNLAVHMLAISDTNWSDTIFERFCSSRYGMVRFACLMELTRFRDQNLLECIRLALNDEFEPTQRFAAIYSGKFGHPDLLADMAALRCQNHLTERVEFDLDNSFRCYDSTLVCNALEKALAECSNYTNPDSIKAWLYDHLEFYLSLAFDIREYLSDSTSTVRRKNLGLSTLRNNPAHYVLPEVMNWLETPALDEDSVAQKTAWEALGWFWMSYRHEDIANLALKVSQDDKFPATVRNEALKTYNRVK